MDVERAFRDHHGALFRFLVRECGDEQVAQDAVQEVFVKLQADSRLDPDRIRSWLFVAGLNVVRDRIRVERNRLRLMEESPHRVPTPRPRESPEEALVRDEDRRRLRKALAELRDKERTALLMREEGFKHREIAAALGTTTASVGTLVARALEKLGAALEEAP